MAGIIPLDLFTTPYSDPYGKSAIQGNPIGDLGQMLNENAKFKQQQAERQRETDQQNALGNRNANINEKHLAEQIDARKQATADQEKTAKEKRFTELEAAFRKAKSASERDLIRQEMTRLGFSVEEVDTSLPEAPALPSAAAPEPGPPPAPVKTGKTPAVDPKFQSALAAEMGKEDPTGTEAPPSPGEPTPMDWSGLGIPPPADASAGKPTKPKRGGKFLIRDAQGNLASTFDEPAEREKARQSVAVVLEPYIGNPSSPEAKQAAANAQKAALGALDAGMGMAEAAKFGAQMYDKQMGQFRDQKLPSSLGAGGGGGGISKQEQTRRGQLSQQTVDFLTKLDTSQKIPDARKAIASMDEMDQALSHAHEEGFAGGNAISSYLRAISGAQVSEAEVHRIYGSAGAQAEWESKLSPYVNGGKLPEELIVGLKGVVARAKQVFSDRISHAVETGQSTLSHITSNASPQEKDEQKKAVRSWLTGKDEETPAPRNDDAERQDLLKKLEKYKR